jgi:hypothetical protein
VDFIPGSGLWQDSGDGRYDGITDAGNDRAVSLVNLGIDHGLEISSVLEMEVTLNTGNTGGLIFDYYDSNTFKFASINADADQLIIGHHTSKGWAYDAAYDIDIEAGTDYDLNLSLKGNTVNASMKVADALNWQGMVGYVFNAVTVDGDFGLLTKDGGSSFDEVTVKTDDPAFWDPDDVSFLTAASSMTDPAEVMSDLTYDELDPIIDAAVNLWTGSTLFDEAMLIRLDGLTFLIADLEGDALALTVGDTVIIDVDAAGHGWFVDDTPYQDAEFIPQGNDEELVANETSDAYGDMDLLTTVMHELGHVFGYQDMDPDTNDAEIMNETLDEGVRYLPEDTFADQLQNNSEGLLSLDLTPDENLTEDFLADLVNESPWLVKYLTDGAEDEDGGPNDDISITLPVDDEEGSGDTTATDTESTSDPVADDPGKGKGKNK